MNSARQSVSEVNHVLRPVKRMVDYQCLHTVCKRGWVDLDLLNI